MHEYQKYESMVFLQVIKMVNEDSELKEQVYFYLLDFGYIFVLLAFFMVVTIKARR